MNEFQMGFDFMFVMLQIGLIAPVLAFEQTLQALGERRLMFVFQQLLGGRNLRGQPDVKSTVSYIADHEVNGQQTYAEQTGV